MKHAIVKLPRNDDQRISHPSKKDLLFTARGIQEEIQPFFWQKYLHGQYHENCSSLDGELAFSINVICQLSFANQYGLLLEPIFFGAINTSLTCFPLIKKIQVCHSSNQQSARLAICNEDRLGYFFLAGVGQIV